MHEIKVRAICGEPVSVKSFGYVLRHYDFNSMRRLSDRSKKFPRGVPLRREVLVTEHVYNFGPHRLMRQLRYEDSILVSIRTLDYGYLD
jgi:hypothetical protein